MTKPEIKNYEKIIESFQTQFPSRFQLIMTDHLRYMKFVFTTKQGENVNVDIFLSPDWGYIDDFLGYLKTVARNSIAKSAERYIYTYYYYYINYIIIYIYYIYIYILLTHPQMRTPLLA